LGSFEITGGCPGGIGRIIKRDEFLVVSVSYAVGNYANGF
jgi:hypothetical protein